MTNSMKAVDALLLENKRLQREIENLRFQLRTAQESARKWAEEVDRLEGRTERRLEAVG